MSNEIWVLPSQKRSPCLSKARRESKLIKFAAEEKSMLNHFERRPGEPDGSFMMGAFVRGWDAAMRAAKKHYGASGGSSER